MFANKVRMIMTEDTFKDLCLCGETTNVQSKDAGFRTHFLVALGSALFCIVSEYGFGETLDDSLRVAAQVVSGVGFLGAGTIIF